MSWDVCAHITKAILILHKQVNAKQTIRQANIILFKQDTQGVGEIEHKLINQIHNP